MPRRKARKLLISGVVTPIDLSRTVVGKYVATAKEKLPDWAGNYTARINEYLADTNRQSAAQAKLAAWYGIYVVTVYPRLKEIFATARAEYIKAIYRPPTPAPGAPGVAPGTLPGIRTPT
jgi:hypothetical protein